MNKQMISKTLMTLVTASAMYLTGCNAPSTDKNLQKNPEEVTIAGKPLGVEYVPRTKYICSAAFSSVFDVNGEIVLAYGSGRAVDDKKFYTAVPYAHASALIQSEMNDGDDELVKLTGQYIGDRFKISSVEANGHKVDLSK